MQFTLTPNIHTNTKDDATKNNLKAAVGLEALGFFKYMIYAAKAHKEGYEQIAGFFEETAMNELEHGKLWMKALEAVGSTDENLDDAIAGESEETSSTYKRFEKIAREEGHDKLADQFKEIGEVEGSHMERFVKLLNLIKKNEVFESNGEIYWKCRNCGYIHKGTTAPNECPACKHPQAFFERQSNNY